MSTPTKPFNYMMRAADDMATATQQSFASFHSPQPGSGCSTRSKKWTEMLLCNAINTACLDAIKKFLLMLSGLMMQGLNNEMAFDKKIYQRKEAEVSDQKIKATIAFMSVFAGLPAITRAITLSVAALSFNKEEEQ